MTIPRRRFLKTAAAAAMLPALPQPRARADLPIAAGAHHRRHRRRRHHRSRRPPDRAMADRQARPAVHGREPHRRQQQHRHRGGGACRARRLHAVHGQLGQCHQHVAVSRISASTSRPTSFRSRSPCAPCWCCRCILRCRPRRCRSSSPTPKPIPARSTWAPAARARPGTCAGELFQMMAGVKFQHVPYRGESLAMADLIGGQVQMVVATVGSSIQYIKAGQVRALAVTSEPAPTRCPTCRRSAETLPGYEATSWSGLMAPKGTPPRDRRQAQPRGQRGRSPIPRSSSALSPSADRRRPTHPPHSGTSSRSTPRNGRR